MGTALKLEGSHFVEKQNSKKNTTIEKTIGRLLIKTLKQLRLPKNFDTDFMNH